MTGINSTVLATWEAELAVIQATKAKIIAGEMPTQVTFKTPTGGERTVRYADTNKMYEMLVKREVVLFQEIQAAQQVTQNLRDINDVAFIQRTVATVYNPTGIRNGVPYINPTPYKGIR